MSKSSFEPEVSSNVDVVPATMRAAVYRGVNDVRVETMPVPEIGAGEVLVKIHTCGICGTDLKKIHTGSHDAPRVFGHEMAGTIVRVGEGVTGFAPSGGGFAEYIRVMDWIVRRGLVKIPDEIPFEQAAFLEPVNTCYKAIQLLNLQSDETVLVIGQGPIGILLAALARKTGATVLTSDLYSERHAIAAKFGLDHPLDARGNVVAAAKAATEGRGADVALLAVGGDALIKVAMEAIRPGGRVVLFAQTQHGEAPFDPAAVCMDEKTLMGSYSSSVSFNEDVNRLVFDGYRTGFNLTNLISHRFSLEDAVAAIELASHPQPTSMKIVIQPRS